MEWDDGETMMIMTMMAMIIYRRFDVADQILVVSSLRWLCGDLLVSHRKAYTHTISNDHTTYTTRSFDDPSLEHRADAASRAASPPPSAAGATAGRFI